MFRVGCVCGGASLYAPQAQNNVVRVAYEAMASVLGGVQSMFTAAWDEPFALPSEASTTLALRTQQVLAYETGVARVADPLGGSYFVEALTDAMEERIIEIMAEVEAHGGMVAGVENGYVQKLIADEAYELQRALEAGRRTVVGLNRFDSEEAAPEFEAYELDEANLRRQLARLEATKREREAAEVRRTLEELAAAARAEDVNLMPRLVDCALAYCTVGEMVAVLKDAWGEFRQPAVF
jgi:methylmalonyl-CoA mutase N-terminal domain/subunit